MATPIVDANGVPIVLGSAVKLTATVTAINPFSNHYAEVELQFTFPGPAQHLNLGHDLSIADGTTATPGIMRRSIAAVPTRINPAMLLVGS